MFYNASAFNQPIGSWNTSNVLSMKTMFQNAKAFSQTLCWDLKQLQDYTSIFDGSRGSFNCACVQKKAIPCVVARPTSPPTLKPTARRQPTLKPKPTALPTKYPSKKPTTKK